MPLMQLVPPSIEPLTVAEAKNFCKSDTDLVDDDALFGLLITSARVYAEAYTARSFISQQWRLVMDSFPGNMMQAVPWGRTFSLPGNAILLERAPVISVDSITYTDMGGAQQTVPSSEYVADLSGPMPRITPGFGKIWPITLPQIGAAAANFTAGYGSTAASVPAGIRDCLLMRVKSRYDMRGEVTVASRGKIEPLPWVDALLDPYRVPSL